MTRMYTQHARRPLFLEKGALPAIVITLSSMAFFHQDFNLAQEVDHAAGLMDSCRNPLAIITNAFRAFCHVIKAGPAPGPKKKHSLMSSGESVQ